MGRLPQYSNNEAFRVVTIVIVAKFLSQVPQRHLRKVAFSMSRTLVSARSLSSKRIQARLEFVAEA
ncbi:hypothetical protein IG631_05439 [Alternaria alternata]|nr:hypothetical protein IG631_05439 [Alternaria alternata]